MAAPIYEPPIPDDEPPEDDYPPESEEPGNVFRIHPEEPPPDYMDGTDKPPAVLEVLPPPSAPLDVADVIGAELVKDGQHTLVRWRDNWMRYVGTHWAKVDDGDPAQWVYRRTQNAMFSKDGQDKPWSPNRTKVNDVLHAYGNATARLPHDVEPNTWLPTKAPRAGVVSTPAGLLKLSDRSLTGHTPRWFCTWALPFSYDGQAAAPSAWLAFLDSVWPDEKPTIDMLQEWLGYLVSGRTDQQKAMFFRGEKRSGKGTILRVCAQLVGAENTASPTMSSFGENFGLEPLIGKTLATVGDARLVDTKTVERLLSIIGEDQLTVDRKYEKAWTGRLGTRIMIASNQALDLRDASGAIASRFLTAEFKQSFYGREDHDLEARLTAEMPGILAWALDGLDRLTRNRKFTETASSVAAREEMEEAGSPAARFLADACVTGADHRIPTEVLFAAWTYWLKAHGHKSTTDATMGTQLRAADTSIAGSKARIGGRRVPMLTGLTLNKAYVGDVMETDFGDVVDRRAGGRIFDPDIVSKAKEWAVEAPDE